MGDSLTHLRDTYRRRGFDKLSPEEHHTMMEVMLSTAIDFQNRLEGIQATVNILARRGEEIDHLNREWAEFKPVVERTKRDQGVHDADIANIRREVAGKAVAAVVALLLLGVLAWFFFVQDARSASPDAASPGVEVDGGTPPVRGDGEPQQQEGEGREGDEDARGQGAGAVWRSHVLGRAGLTLLYPRQQLRLAPRYLGGLAVQAPLSRPPLGGVHKPQAFLGIASLADDPRHLLEEAGRRGVGQERAVGQGLGEGLYGPRGVPHLPAYVGAAGQQEGRHGVGVGQAALLEEAVGHRIETGNDGGVADGQPLACEGVGFAPPPCADRLMDGQRLAVDGLPLAFGQGSPLPAPREDHHEHQT